MRSDVSKRMALTPSSAKYSAISQPVAPAPTTATTLGKRRMVIADSGVRHLTKAAPEMPSVLRLEPVAMMKLLEVYFFSFTAMV